VAPSNLFGGDLSQRNVLFNRPGGQPFRVG